MVGRRTPMVVSDHTNGTEVPMRTLTAVQRRYGISPNKIYRLVFSGERTMVDDRQGGGTVETAFHPESQHTAETVPEVFLPQLVIRVALQARIVDTLNCRMLLEELSHRKGVLAMPLGTQ